MLEGNYIGTDPTGIFAEGNGGYGVELDYGVGDGGTKATVGGLTPIPGTGAGNVISGNGLSNIWIFQAQPQAIEGNIIGLNATGTAALGVATEGIYIWDTTIPITIGGTAAGARNVISGNDGAGIFLDDAGYNTGIGPVKNLVVEGNDIGTDITGTIAIGNGTTGNGITITASNSNTIGGSAAGAGNVISGNSGDGVEITGSGTTGNVVAGNYIGTDITGTVAVPNGSDGVEIDTSASGNTIGGTTALARNIISGNTAWGVGILPSATDNVVAGNFIGADVTGDVALANTIGVYIHSSDNTIGGTAVGAGNVIAGNADAPLYDRAQVLIRNTGSTDNVVEGNLIGLGANGQAFSGAVNVGVWLDTGATGNTIGGTTAAARNVISGNLGGVQMNGDVGDVVEGNYIGTNIAGTSGIGNGNPGSGVTVENGTDNTIGGSVAGAGNVISGNAGNGVYILDSNAADNLIEGNLIGTDYTGTVRISNSNDIFFDNTSGGNTIGGATSVPGTGAGNIIAYSGHSGIAIANDTAGDVILGNAIIDNATNLDIPETGVSLSGDIDPHVGGTGAGDGNLISGNNGDGIAVQDSTNTLIQGNLIGTDAAGTSAFANRFDGVLIDSASTGTTVGGTASGAGNVISGNTTDGVEITGSGTTGNVVAGNYIGTDITGTVAIPNGTDGVEIDTSASGNTIGGTTAAARNVISANSDSGVMIDEANDNLVEGNYVGTNAAGTAALANDGDGVEIYSGGIDNTIGSGTTSDANVISGNTGYGIQVDGASTTGNILDDNFVGTGAGGLGTVLNSGGALEITNGAAVLAQGTFTGNVLNEGTLGFWDAPSVITIVGNYTQTAAGILDIDLGGTSSSQYDQLLVSGTATLAGTLDVDLIDAFSIGLAEEFQVLTYDVLSGTFTTDDYPNGVTLYPDYTSTILYLFSSPTELVTTTADMGPGSLRQAIESADAATNPSDIAFDIPASDPGYSNGVWTVSPDTALPAITEPVILDGTSQPGYAGTPIIVLVGTDAGSSASGLILDANGSTIRGLVIDDFGQDGLSVQGNDNTVAGNYMGVDVDREDGGGQRVRASS